MRRKCHIIDQPLAEFLESNVAMLVASCDNSNYPVISRGFGARVSDDCAQVTIFVTEKQSAELLSDILQTRQLVLNAARVTDYESYQLKGNNAVVSELSLKDERHILHYIESTMSEMMKVGVTPPQAAAIFQSRDTENIVGIQFTVKEVYTQTPGPGAGEVRELSS